MQANCIRDKELYIVFNDTLWRNGINDDQRLALAAHEQGHYIINQRRKSFISINEILVTLLFLIGFSLFCTEISNNINRAILILLITTWVSIHIYLILFRRQMRNEELLADAHAVKILENPEWLIEALRIAYNYNLVPNQLPKWIEVILEDHPSLENRIKQIRGLASTQ